MCIYIYIYIYVQHSRIFSLILYVPYVQCHKYVSLDEAFNYNSSKSNFYNKATFSGKQISIYF